MYDKNLTLEGALQKIGNVVDEQEHVIGNNHPLTIALRNFVTNLNSHGLYDSGTKECRQEINRQFDELGIDNYHQQACEEGYELDFTLDFLFPSVKEALLNAIEHGSQFGSKGPVRLILKKGSSGLLSIVEDPGPGFDVDSALTQTREGARSKGLNYFTKSSMFAYNVEKGDDCFRTLFLYGKRRLL